MRVIIPYLGMAARCHGCLTEDVAVKVTDLAGCEHYFCVPCWACEEALAAKVTAMLADAAARADEGTS